MATGKLYNGVFSTLPQLTTPDPKQQATGYTDWVQFGIDNCYPQYTADLVTISPTHEAVTESKRNFLNGNLKIDTKDTILDLEDIDTVGGTLEELIDDTNANLGIYESFYWEILYNKTKTRIVGINSIPYENVRVGKYNDEGKIDTVYVSPDWSRKYTKKNTPKPMAVFNPKSIDTDSQVMIVRVKRPNQPYYTVPSYMSAVQYILLEDDIASLNRNDVTNGFFPSMIMNFFNGEPTDDDKAGMESYINNKFSGATGSKLMMFYGTDPDKKVQLDTFESPNLGDYSEQMVPLVENKILSSHRAPGGLVGISTGSGFSSKSEETQTAFQLYLKNVVVPLQKLIINALKKVYKFNGSEAEIMFENELLLDNDSSVGELEDAANAEVNDKKEVESKEKPDKNGNLESNSKQNKN